jgi:hypothetical protein
MTGRKYVKQDIAYFVPAFMVKVLGVVVFLCFDGYLNVPGIVSLGVCLCETIRLTSITSGEEQTALLIEHTGVVLTF